MQEQETQIQETQTQETQEIQTQEGINDDFDFDFGEELQQTQETQTQETQETQKTQEQNQNLVDANILLDIALNNPNVAQQLLNDPSFTALANSNPEIAQKLQNLQLNLQAQQEPQPQQNINDPLFEIAKQASYRANEIFKQATGQDFDPVLATPEERAYYELILQRERDALIEQYQTQVEQQRQMQIAQQTMQVVKNLATQKFGADFIANVQNLINQLPYGEYVKLDKEYTEAVLAGDVNGALNVLEKVKAYFENASSKPVNPLNNLQPSNTQAQNLIGQAQGNDINDELINLANF